LPWQAGLMAAQYTMDLIDAGYSYSHGFPGFEGDKAKANDNPQFTAVNRQGELIVGPIYRTNGMIGEVLRMSRDGYTDELLCEKKDDKTIVMALDPGPANRIYLFVMNKRETAVVANVNFDIPVKAIGDVYRFSKEEADATRLVNKASGQREFQPGANVLKIALPGYSFTRIELIR